MQVSIEMVPNLIYLARHTEASSAQQNEYLERAAKIVEEIPSDAVRIMPALSTMSGSAMKKLERSKCRLRN
jgi:hypothetical protein